MKMCENCIYFKALDEVSGVCELSDHVVGSDEEYECWEGDEDDVE